MLMFWLLLLASYLIGSVPTALIVGKLVFGVDIRDHGSKNPGATNTLRVLGKKSAGFRIAYRSCEGSFGSLPANLL